MGDPASVRTANAITYGAYPAGYTVFVLKDGEIVDEYNAGNYQLESTTYVEPGSPGSIPLPELRRMAAGTAAEMAEEWDVDPKFVGENEDISREGG